MLLLLLLLLLVVVVVLRTATAAVFVTAVLAGIDNAVFFFLLSFLSFFVSKQRGNFSCWVGDNGMMELDPESFLRVRGSSLTDCQTETSIQIIVPSLSTGTVW